MPQARAGDVVSRRKGLVMHKGIALGDGRVLHNTPFRGEHITSESEFRAGRRMYIESSDVEDRARTRRLAESAVYENRNYHLLRNNCEHTVTRVTTGEPRSPQLHSWILGAGFAAATFALTRHPGAAAAAYAVGRGLSARLRR